MPLASCDRSAAEIPRILARLLSANNYSNIQKSSFWLATETWYRLNAWLRCQVIIGFKCSSWIGCNLTHRIKKLDLYNCISLDIEVVYLILSLNRSRKHKWITWAGGLDSHVMFLLLHHLSLNVYDFRERRKKCRPVNGRILCQGFYMHYHKNFR